MIDFPITQLLSEEESLLWLEEHLHPEGWDCPDCHSTNRRNHREQRYFDSHICQECDCYHTLLTGTVFEGSRQSASTLVMLLRGIAKGESTMRLHREIGMSYKQVLTLRHRIQENLHESAPRDRLSGTEFEVDELYQNAGEKRRTSPRPR